MIQRMKKVGLYQAAVGFEASTPYSLEVLNKRATIEDNYRANNLFTRNYINVFGFLIMFHPYTSFEELKTNANFLLEMDMAYQPQNWWSELYLWPDSRILPNIVRDGLLLGPEHRGYQLLYAFQDGRVGKVHKVLQEIGDLGSIRSYTESIEKVKLECILYDVWKDQYEEMRVIEDEMQAYQELYKNTRKVVGSKQYEIFMRLLEAVESNTLQSQKDALIKEWDELGLTNYQELERNWVRFRMQFGRKKVVLI
ncbi:MAG TPA: hypothetical protein VIO64_19355 [Pseudobacteroides sp.]|uniref:hypothetical protein n=1 Tax=Pseudobacteroides sp. TaxID=1968840 RepID=UPI002F932190